MPAAVSAVNLRADLATRLDAVCPILARNAAQGAAVRRIPDESIDALAAAGLFKLMAPKRHGGYEGSVATLLEAAASVAAADGATGWVVARLPHQRPVALHLRVTAL